MERALKKARAEIDERAHSEAEIRRLNAELEQRIAERAAQLAVNEERYRLITSVTADYMFSSRLRDDDTLELTWVAGAFEKITGYTHEEYVARGGWRACLHPDDRQIDQADMEKLKANQPVIGEMRTFTKGGTIRWVRVYAHPVWDEARQALTGICGAVQDITERKQTEDALRASERRFRTLVEQLPAITYIDSAEELGKTLYVSPQFEHLTGYPLKTNAQEQYHTWLAHVHPDDHARVLEEYRRCFEYGEPLETEYRFLARDQGIIWMQDRAIRLESANGQPEHILGVITDITERKQVEHRLEQQATQLAVLYQLGQMIAGAGSLEEIYQASQQTVEKLMPSNAFYVALFDEARQVIEYVYLTDRGTRFPNETVPISDHTLTAHVIKTGEPLVIADDARRTSSNIRRKLYGSQEFSRSLLIAPLKLGGKVMGAFSTQHYQPDMYTDEHTRLFVTLANQVATAIENTRLMQSLRLQAAALDAAANAIMISDIHGIIQWVNPAFTTLTGYSAEEAIGQKTSLLRSGVQEQEFYEAIWRELAAGQVWQGEIVNRRKDGSLYTEEQIITPVRDEQGNVFRYISIKQDITRRKQTEEREARRREMMEKVIDLGKAVTKINDLESCLREIHRSVQTGLKFDRVGIFLYDETTRQVRGTFGTTRTGEIKDSSRFSEAVDEHPGWLKAISDPHSISVVDDFEAFVAEPDEMMTGVKQHVTLSAWAGEKPVAVITADNLITGRKFSEEQLEALQLFAGYAGLAIENAHWNLQLEQRVTERTRELAAANRELESLAYTIAHDLRIPVRAMHGFASILKETEAGNLNFESLGRLDRIRDSAKEMGQLVDDLLEFMRLGRIKLNRRMVDMNSLAQAAWDSLEKESAGREVMLRVQDLPDCQGDLNLLKQVWLCLLSNALKFTRLRPVAEIEIGAQEEAGVTQYFVRDNGIGFDMEFSGKLFGAFQRLHHADEFEGTGIGLALVQRIIQRHGGHIWAQAEIDQGATFYFTLG